MNSFDSSVPSTIVDQVLRPLGVVAAESMAPGMSGARVYQCRCSSGESLALKCWPAGTKRERVDEIHRVIRHARAAGCQLVPELISLPHTGRQASVVTSGGRHWDLIQWMPGTACEADATLEQIRNGAAAIAQFHHSVRALGVQHQPPPAVAARLRRLRELEDLVPRLLAAADTISGQDELPRSLKAAAGVVRSKWVGARARIARSLQQYANTPVPTHYVLRDIHRGHLLFADQIPSGLIDFDAVRIDTPAADLARWVGSFLVGRQANAPVWDAAMAGFHDVYSLNGESIIAIDPDFAAEIYFATTWISLVNWLDWILCQQRSFPPGPAAVSARICELTSVADHCESQH